MSDSQEYYLRRVRQELEAAEEAGDPGASQIHRELARHYRQLLSGTGVSERDLPNLGANGAVRPLHAGQ